MRMSPTTRLEPLAQLIEDWGHTDADIVIAGDGSGKTWASPCGWGTVLVDRTLRTRRRTVFYAGMNLGTSALAEVMPYFHALSWHQANRGDELVEQLGRPIRTLIVTDCKSLVDTCDALVKRERPITTVRSNRPALAALLAFEGLGYELRFRWEPRLSTALNCYCDDLAGRCREQLEAGAEPGPIAPPRIDGRSIAVRDCNPDGPTVPPEIVELRPVVRASRKKRLA